MKEKKSAFSEVDCFVIVIIAFVALLTRLWRLGLPNQIVFDEVYFGNFSNAYITRHFYSDIHPPLGKLIMAGIGYLTGYPGNINWGKEGYDYYDNETNYVSLRITPCVFSSFCSVLIYASLRNLKCTILTATTGAFLVLFDMTSIVEGRMILSDAMLHFFTCLHIWAFTLFLRKTNMWRTLLAGVTLGAAFSCKLTAMGLIALDGVTQLIWVFKDRPKFSKMFGRAFCLLAPCIGMWYASWMVHHSLMVYKDDTQAYTESFFSPFLIDKTKENWTNPAIRVINRFFLKQVIDDNVETHHANMRITQPHPWSSMPINWPLLRDKYVFFHTDEDGSTIRCLGSPFVYWSTTIGILLTPILAIFGYVDSKVFVSFLGWTFSYVPFVLVPRAMYMYHYIVPVMFASMNLACLIENIFRGRTRNTVLISVCILSAACLLFFAPWVYSTPCDKECEKRLTWMREWNDGPEEPLNTYGATAFDTKVVYGNIPYFS